MRRIPIVLALSFAVFVAGQSRADAIPITADTFEDGTTMGWFVPSVMGPSPNPPENIPTGGPAGGGDNYLQLVANGLSGPGSRLSVLNDAQWTGDFRAAGITAIGMDVNNFGPEELTLRLLFEDFDGPGPPTNLVTTLANIVVPAGSGWTHIVFDLAASNLTALFGTVENAMTDVDTLRIFHNPVPTFPGPGVGIPVVTATLGVDNITAVIADVPEPGTTALLLGALGAALYRMRRRN